MPVKHDARGHRAVGANGGAVANGAGGAGLAAGELGATWVHAGCGGEGGLSPRQLVDGGGRQLWLRRSGWGERRDGSGELRESLAAARAMER
jgi:hypothetical protein